MANKYPRPAPCGTCKGDADNHLPIYEPTKVIKREWRKIDGVGKWVSYEVMEVQEKPCPRG